MMVPRRPQPGWGSIQNQELELCGFFFTVSGFKTIFHSCRDRRHKNAFLYFKYKIRKNPKIFHALHSGFVHQVNVYLSTVVNDS